MNLHTTYGGEYKFTILDADRNVKRETEWMPNLITDIGLDRIAAGIVGTHCRIGTGNTTPANADTALVSQSASTTNTAGTSSSNAGAPNYQTENSNTFEFALGAVVGNMAEVGIGWAASGATLFSRALTVNGGGTPTAITVLVTEILQVTYRLTSYPILTDTTSTVTIGTSYTYVSRVWLAGTTRAINITSIDQTNSAQLTAYNGSLGATTAGPSGSSAGGGTAARGSYTAGNRFLDYTFNMTIAQGNVAGGITAMAVFVGGSASFRTQMSFSPAIPKDGTNTLSITIRQSWARR